MGALSWKKHELLPTTFTVASSLDPALLRYSTLRFRLLVLDSVHSFFFADLNSTLAYATGDSKRTSCHDTVKILAQKLDLERPNISTIVQNRTAGANLGRERILEIIEAADLDLTQRISLSQLTLPIYVGIASHRVQSDCQKSSAPIHPSQICPVPTCAVAGSRLFLF